MWPFLEYARHRLDAFLAEVGRLQESEFPYIHSKDALDLLAGHFSGKRKDLEAFDEKSNVDTVKQACALTLRDLFVYLPLLGFILRSTNIRNAFEVFRPLLNLVRDVLDGTNPADRKTRLVLSSEWDYSPLMFGEIPELPKFVLIGLPACESTNPLLLPLAGHEFGHSVWSKSNLSSHFRSLITKEIVTAIIHEWQNYLQAFKLPQTTVPADLTTDLFLVQTWQQIVELTERQVEESFCDFVGLRIFYSSYLYAFAYLLSPTHGSRRSPTYPSTPARVANLVKAAGAYGINVPAGYEDSFQDDPVPTLSPANTFRLSIADKALEAMIDELIRKADDLLSSIAKPSDQEVNRIYQRFLLVVPAESCRSLADILNAGWRAMTNNELWSSSPQFCAKREATVKDLILKTIEVFQIEQTPP